MEELNQNQSNQIIGVPQVEQGEENTVEQTARPVTENKIVTIESSPEAKPAETIQPNKLEVVKKILRNLQESVDSALRLLESDDEPGAKQTMLPLALASKTDQAAGAPLIQGKIVEGVFDGESMVGPDGQIYQVPPNYASKSKLVEGDILKLAITPKGAFIFKQIGPVERERLKGSLLKNNDNGEYAVAVDDKIYRILKASITYFKGNEGDEVILLAPKGAVSRWAAVENVVKKRI